ncbi:hypothetical protein GNP80_15885 [Aliivibrio fischeri]|nr:hypothetical protein [Aliivibrio fischeri]
MYKSKKYLINKELHDCFVCFSLWFLSIVIMHLIIKVDKNAVIFVKWLSWI